jgi:hypothetical protein
MPALFITAASSGDNTLLAAVTGKRITVKSFELFNGAATANTVKFRSAANDITLPVTFPASAVGLKVGASAPGSQFLFQTVAGELLALNLSAATAIGGVLFYELN